MNQNPDFIYASLTLGNTQPDINVVVPASGFYQSTSPILTKPDDYIGRIQRLETSGLSIPLIVPLTQIGQNDPNLLVYKFAMGYNGMFSDPINVVFIPQSTGLVTPNPPLIYQDLRTSYYYLYSYSSLLYMWNIALAAALANLNGKIVTGVSEAPVFYFDPDYGIVLKAIKTGYAQFPTPVTVTNFIQIYCDSTLLTLVNGFPLNYISNVSGCNYSFNLYDQVTNEDISTTHYIQKQQNIASLAYWPSLNIVQVQSTMPVQYESLPAPIGTASIGQNNQQSQVSNVLTDIVIDSSINPVSYSSPQIFNNTDILRVFNITKTSPLYSIDASLYWIDYFGRPFPLLLGINETITIKFEFIKKDIYAGIFRSLKA